MKYLFTTITIALLSITNIFAQEEDLGYYLFKGEVFLEGNLGYNSVTNEQRDNKTTAYYINPKAGYFIADDIAVGIDLSYSQSEEASAGVDTNNIKNISGGIFGRYYFLPLGERFKVYTELGGAYISQKDGIDIPINASGFELGLDMGINYFFKESLAISFTLADLVSYKTLTFEEREISEFEKIEEQTVSELNADINIINNFFQTARFGILYKF